jgi:multidrug resistance efflux pump
MVSVNTTVLSSGGLEPEAIAIVRPIESGRVSRVFVKTGQTVKAGDLLFSLDTVGLAADLLSINTRLKDAKLDEDRASKVRPIDIQTAMARRQVASVSLSKARAALLVVLLANRGVTNIDSALSSTAEGVHVSIDGAKSDVRQAEMEARVADLAYERLLADSLDEKRSTLDQSEMAAQVTALRRRLASMDVRSPSDGVVLTDGLETLVGAGVREGDTIMEIGSKDSWRVRVLVSEDQAQRVSAGQDVDLTVKALERGLARRICGVVLSVAEEPWSAERTAGPMTQQGGVAPRYLVMVRMTPSTSDSVFLLRRGLTVDARIKLGRKRLLKLMLDKLFSVRTEGDR